MEWDNWMGKKVFVQLKSGGYYNGEVISIEVGTPSFFEIRDKYGKIVCFVTSEIVKIAEED